MTDRTWTASFDDRAEQYGGTVTAGTKRELLWILTSSHMDANGHATRTARAGEYNYTAPDGTFYSIRKEGVLAWVTIWIG